MSKVQGPRSIHSPLSFMLLSRGGNAGGPDFFSRRTLGAEGFTRESSHDVSNNIRGEKSILAIFSEDFLWSVEVAEYQLNVMQIYFDCSVAAREIRSV